MRLLEFVRTIHHAAAYHPDGPVNPIHIFHLKLSCKRHVQKSLQLNDMSENAHKFQRFPVPIEMILSLVLRNLHHDFDVRIICLFLTRPQSNKIPLKLLTTTSCGLTYGIIHLMDWFPTLSLIILY